jgi:hypothetical protein
VHLVRIRAEKTAVDVELMAGSQSLWGIRARNAQPNRISYLPNVILVDGIESTEVGCDAEGRG